MDRRYRKLKSALRPAAPRGELEPTAHRGHAGALPLLLVVSLAGKIAALVVVFVSSSTALALALWFAPDLWLGYQLFVPHAQGLVRTHRRFAAEGRDVWLTIDDGPDPDDTPQLLALLATHRAKATFFVIGERARAHPELIRAIAGAGHEVAHHTQTHPLYSFWCASPSRVARELDAGLAALHDAGVQPTRFRPPAGLKNLWLRRALTARGLQCIGWSARGLERQAVDADAVVARVTRDLVPGAILLLHEGPRLPRAIRVEAIRRTLERLKELGYRCVMPTAGQLRD